ncbi:MAG TPA: undecaprenyl-diphosphate phosphatase [Bacteroidales bacterium]|nr:undecaprenyl-diphosphate phosphatase [Bacteroidales bacterium]
MNWIEAIILGIVQGLTEFLPVSSSGHLEIGQVLLGTDINQSLTFTVVVHGATVLSTIVVFFSEIVKLLKEGLTFRYNESTKYILKIFLSMVPVLIIGLLFEEQVETLFGGNLRFVGSMLLVTALLLGLTSLKKQEGQKHIPFVDALIIGVAQALAVIPGISRSGATISTGVLLGNKREDVARFSFLMVLLPIIGANLLDILKMKDAPAGGINGSVLIIGFLAAFISGLFACRWMINIVKRGKLIYFAVYCVILGLIAIIFA